MPRVALWGQPQSHCCINYGKDTKKHLNYQFPLIHKLHHLIIANKRHIPQFIFSSIMESNTCVDKQLRNCSEVTTTEKKIKNREALEV